MGGVAEKKVAEAGVEWTSGHHHQVTGWVLPRATARVDSRRPVKTCLGIKKEACSARETKRKRKTEQKKHAMWRSGIPSKRNPSFRTYQRERTSDIHLLRVYVIRNT